MYYVHLTVKFRRNLFMCHEKRNITMAILVVGIMFIEGYICTVLTIIHFTRNTNHSWLFIDIYEFSLFSQSWEYMKISDYVIS